MGLHRQTFTFIQVALRFYCSQFKLSKYWNFSNSKIRNSYYFVRMLYPCHLLGICHTVEVCFVRTVKLSSELDYHVFYINETALCMF